jgi:hypothetical protein
MEIQLHNPWLTYGMGMHRLREAGLLPDIFNLLDERPFTLDQLHEFCKSLFLGDNSAQQVKLPHPRESLTSFFQTLKIMVDMEEIQWNPIRKKMMPWIDMERLEAIHCRRQGSQRPLRRSISEGIKDPPEDKQQRPKYARFSSTPNVATNVHRQSSTPLCNPLQHFLLTVPQMLPPTNTTVEMHGYFSKWKTFDEDAFHGFSGDELVELLAKGLCIVLLFLVLYRCYDSMLTVYLILIHTCPVC